jgi:hypothetical protein
MNGIVPVLEPSTCILKRKDPEQNTGPFAHTNSNGTMDYLSSVIFKVFEKSPDFTV